MIYIPIVSILVIISMIYDVNKYKRRNRDKPYRKHVSNTVSFIVSIYFIALIIALLGDSYMYLVYSNIMKFNAVNLTLIALSYGLVIALLFMSSIARVFDTMILELIERYDKREKAE